MKPTLKARWLAVALTTVLLAQTPLLLEAKTTPLFKDQAAAAALLEQDKAATLAQVEAYIAKHPKKGEGYYWRGYLHHEAKEDALAIEDLERAKDYDKDWPTLSLLLSLYLEEGEQGKARATAAEGVKYYKGHKKKVTATPAEIASMYFWACEYKDGLKLFPNINADGELNAVRAMMCLELALAERNDGSIYKAKAYATKGLQYDSGNQDLVALDKELSAAIEEDKGSGSSYGGHDHYYRYCYWERPYWFYLSFCWPHHFHHPPPPPPGGWRPGHMPPPPPPAHHEGPPPGGSGGHWGSPGTPPPPDSGGGAAGRPPKGQVMLPNMARGGSTTAPKLSRVPAPRINVPSSVLQQAGSRPSRPSSPAAPRVSTPTAPRVNTPTVAKPHSATQGRVLLPEGGLGPKVAQRPAGSSPSTKIVRRGGSAPARSGGSRAMGTVRRPLGGSSAPRVRSGSSGAPSRPVSMARPRISQPRLSSPRPVARASSGGFRGGSRPQPPPMARGAAMGGHHGGHHR